MAKPKIFQLSYEAAKAAIQEVKLRPAIMLQSFACSLT